MANYEFHIKSFSAPAAGVATFVFPANSLRRCLIISLNLAATFCIVDFSNAATTGQWARFGLPGIYPLSFRDYGPIICEPVWFNSLSILTGLSITEIVLVAQMPKGK